MMKVGKMKLSFLAAVMIISGCAKKPVLNPDDKLSVNGSKTNSLQAQSAAGDVVGKITVGYQGWFACTGDGSYFNNWWHWSVGNTIPTASNVGIAAWPDVREYITTYQTGFANLGNGQPANLFSSFNDQTIVIHFQWMKQNGIDAAAIQRFDPSGGEGTMRDATMVRVKSSAEANGVKFYVMYDISNWDNFQAEIKTDWTNKMSTYTSSSAYARQNGKPVVCIWGLGFADRTMTPAAELDVVNWFKSQGCYMIGGVPHEWRQYTQAGSTDFDAVFKSLNMISPWMIGVISTPADADNFYTNYTIPDIAYCKANGIDYQPCVLPGDLSQRQRLHGDFMWRQFYNMVRAGVQGIYVSMFDEFNEGNQIVKTAENTTMIPVGSNFKGLDEDGTKCSSDYYLRLTNDGGKMLKGQIPLTSVRPTAPIAGGSQQLPPIGSSVTIKGNNGLFASGENGIGPMYCNKFTAHTWETFKIVDAGSGKVALQSMGKYVSSENGEQAITCNRTAIGLWESFDYIFNSDGTVSFRGNDGSYITQENGVIPMICDRTAVGIWEKFTLITSR